MRILGSGLVIAAYFITLHLDVVTGVVVHLTAISISMPYFVKSKAWDVVVMFSFLINMPDFFLVQEISVKKSMFIFSCFLF